MTIDNHDLTEARYCETCHTTQPVTDQFMDEFGPSDDGRVYDVTVLGCGHEISREKR